MASPDAIRMPAAEKRLRIGSIVLVALGLTDAIRLLARGKRSTTD